MMALLLEFPEHRPETLQGMTEDTLVSLFSNPLIRSFQIWGVQNPAEVKFRHVITFIDPGALKSRWIKSIEEVNALIKEINSTYKDHHIQYAGISSAIGHMSITGAQWLSHGNKWISLFAPGILISPSGSSTLQKMENGFDIDILGTSHRAFLHTTIGFSWYQWVLPWATKEIIYVSWDVHFIDDLKDTRVDKSAGWNMIPFSTKPSKLKVSNGKKRSRGEVLGPKDLMRYEGFRDLYEALKDANIHDSFDYHQWLSSPENLRLIQTCTQQLNDAWYLTANLAPDWSVWSGKLSESLGFRKEGIENLQKNYFDDGREKKMLLKWAGNNIAPLKNITTQKVASWNTEWIGDNLYVDMVSIFSRMLGILLPQMSSMTHLREYIAYHIVDILRKKYRRDYANQYGSIEIKPDEMKLSSQEVMWIMELIESEMEKVQAWWKLTPIDSHGEFEWQWDTHFLGSVEVEIRKIKSFQLEPFFRTLIDSRTQTINVSRFLLHGCFPFDFTWGDFRDISRIYKNVFFDLIISKRSSSHQDDLEFYIWLDEATNLLAPWGLYITDGMRQSYTRVMRLQSEELYRLFSNVDIEAFLVIDYRSPPGEVKSLILYKKDANNPDKNDLVADFIEEQLPPNHNLILIEKTEIKGKIDRSWKVVTQRSGILEPFFHSKLNQYRMYVRDQIGPEKFDGEIHKILQKYCKTENASMSLMVEEILIYLTAQGMPPSGFYWDSIKEEIQEKIKKNLLPNGLLPPWKCIEILESLPKRDVTMIRHLSKASVSRKIGKWWHPE